MIEITIEAGEARFSEKVDALKLLMEEAESKGNHLDTLRQVNFSMTLFVFAGLTGFGINQSNLVVRLCIIVVLTAFMLILSDYDHNLHKYLHGWRRTKEKHLLALSNLINNPASDVTFQTYYKDGEEKAVKEDCHSIKNLLSFFAKRKDVGQRIPSRMRVVYYLLVRGAIASLIPFLFMKMTS